MNLVQSDLLRCFTEKTDVWAFARLISEFYRFCRMTESRARNYLGLKNVFEEEFRANPTASFAQCLPKNSLKSNRIESILNHSLILDPNFRADLRYMVAEFEKINGELNLELCGRFREYITINQMNISPQTPTTSNSTFSFTNDKCK